MPLIIIIALVTGLKYFEVWKFAELAWWHVIALMVGAFIWFEYIEKILGLDRNKQAHNIDEQRRKQRLQETFNANQKKKKK